MAIQNMKIDKSRPLLVADDPTFPLGRCGDGLPCLPVQDKPSYNLRDQRTFERGGSKYSYRKPSVSTTVYLVPRVAT